MSRVKSFASSSVFAWAPRQDNNTGSSNGVASASIVAGTSAEQLDASFNSSSFLHYCPITDFNSKDLLSVQQNSVEHRHVNGFLVFTIVLSHLHICFAFAPSSPSLSSLLLLLLVEYITWCRFHAVIWSRHGGSNHGTIVGACDNGVISIFDAYKLISGTPSKIHDVRGHSGSFLLRSESSDTLH